MAVITSYDKTSATAKAFRALNKYGMNLADFAAATSTSSYTGFGNGTGYSVGNWISDGVFADLAAVQAAYPICQSTADTVDWVLLQSAIDFMIYGSLGSSNYGSTKRKLFIPAGVFQCNRPLQIGYATLGTPPAGLNGNGYVSITIEGEGPHYDPSGNGMTGTTVYFPYTNDLGIAINRGVQVYLRGMTVKGAYTYPYSFSILNDSEVWDVATWKDPSLPSLNFIDGDAPNIGIAVDPYSGVASAANYPARILPAYFGGGTTTAQITGGGSSFVTIEDVNITNFVIGYGRPHGDGNGEFIQMNRGSINGCVYGIVNGHSQNRNVSIRDINVGLFHTAINNEGGEQGNANLHGVYSNIHAAYGFQLINHSAADWSGLVTISQAYAEGTYRIGTFLNNFELDNCYFSFYDGDGTKGSVYNHLDVGGSVARITNSTFGTMNGLFIKNSTNSKIIRSGNAVVLRNSTVTGDAADAYRYVGGMFQRFGPGSGHLDLDRTFIDVLGQETVMAWDADISNTRVKTHALQQVVKYSAAFPTTDTNDEGSNTLIGPNYTFNVPLISRRYVNIGTMSSRSGFDMTFTRLNLGTLKADVGDIFMVGPTNDERIVCIVTAIVGSNMVLRQQNDYYGTTLGDYQANGRTQLTTGVGYSADYICTRVRRNPMLVMGSVTDGSEIITNVKSALDNANAVTTSELTMAVGDLYIHPEIEMLNAGGSPTSPLNIVTAIDTTAQTITLTNDFNVTNPHYPVVFYVKVFNA
jgi:hypothetical protein